MYQYYCCFIPVALASAERVIEGEFVMGRQYHFYLETQVIACKFVSFLPGGAGDVLQICINSPCV